MNKIFLIDVVPANVMFFAKGHYCPEGSHGWYTHVLPMVKRLFEAQQKLGLSDAIVEKALYAVLFHDSGAEECRERHEQVGAVVWEQAFYLFEELSEKGSAWMEDVRSAIEHHRHSGGWDYSQLPLLDELVATLDRNPPSTDAWALYGRALRYGLEHGYSGEAAAQRALDHVRGKFLGKSFTSLYRKLYGDKLEARDKVIRNTTVEDLLKLL